MDGSHKRYNQMRACLVKWVITGICLLAGLVYFFYRFGYATFNPVNVNWLLHDCDPGMNFIGWHFFRSEPWTLPPGAIHRYFAPIGTSIALTDSIPLMAFLFKTISDWLPSNFQYIGLWILINYCLQALFGLMLMRTFTRQPVLQLLGACLFLLSPILMRRTPHAALTAHWLILAALWLNLRGTVPGQCRKTLVLWFALLFCSSLTHPYFTVMIMGLFFAHSCQMLFFDRLLSLKSFTAVCTGAFCTIGSLWYLSGYFIHNSEGLQGAVFGHYSMNLNALINPSITSSFFNGLDYVWCQPMESYEYLGSGMIVLVLIAVIRGICVRPRKAVLRFSFLAIVLIVSTLFAISHKVTFGEQVLFQVPFPSALAEKLRFFQAHARFFWPVYYMIMVLAIASVLRFRSQWLAGLLLTAVLVAQIVEFRDFANKRSQYAQMEPISFSSYAALQPVIQRFDTLILVPPFCTKIETPNDYLAFAYLCGNTRGLFAGGYAARRPSGPINRFRKQITEYLEKGIPDPGTLYVFQPEVHNQLFPRIQDRYVSKNVAGYILCCAKSRSTDLH